MSTEPHTSAREPTATEPQLRQVSRYAVAQLPLAGCTANSSLPPQTHARVRREFEYQTVARVAAFLASPPLFVGSPSRAFDTAFVQKPDSSPAISPILPSYLRWLPRSRLGRSISRGFEPRRRRLPKSSQKGTRCRLIFRDAVLKYKPPLTLIGDLSRLGFYKILRQLARRK